MRRNLLVAMLGMALGLASAGGVREVTASPGHQAARGGPAVARTITVITKSREFLYVDTGPPGPSQGDMRVLNAPLFDRRGIRRVGRLDMVIVLTDLADDRTEKFHVALETGVYKLAGGTIAFQGTASFYSLKHLPLPTALAITGGTGAYAGARGQIHFVTRGARVINTVSLLP